MAEIENRYCTYCRSNTKQKKVFESSKLLEIEVPLKKEKTDLADIVYTAGVQIEEVFQCLGCEKVHIFYTEKQLFPSVEPRKYQLPMRREREIPNWLVNVNIDYFDLISEIYSNFNSGHYITFSIATRTLLDVILTEALGDIGGFEQKLNRFMLEGRITKKQHKILDFLVTSGNASAHRAYKPAKEVASNILDIIEYLLKEDVLDKRSDSQRLSIPGNKNVP